MYNMLTVCLFFKVVLLTLRVWVHVNEILCDKGWSLTAVWLTIRVQVFDCGLSDVETCVNVMYLPFPTYPEDSLLTPGFCLLSLKICTINVYSLTYRRFCKPTSWLIKKFHEFVFYLYCVYVCARKYVRIWFSSIAHTHTHIYIVFTNTHTMHMHTHTAFTNTHKLQMKTNLS